MSGERTEQPTQKRKQDARKRGQVAVSREVDSALVLLGAVAALKLGGGAMWAGFEGLMRDSFANLDTTDLNSDVSAQVGTAVIGRAVMLMLPMLLVIAAVGVISGVGQTGGVMATQALKPQWGRLNPMSGAKRLFATKQSLVNLAKNLAKFAVLGTVATLTLKARLEDITALGVGASLPASVGTLVDIGFELVWKVVAALVVLAAADFVFQRYDVMSKLRMSKQEVKEEHRQQEGDPQVRGQRSRMRRSFLTRVMQAVPEADVVLTNPTHYAVALKYDPAVSSAPKVIAKGERLIALRIREMAAEHGIPVIQNPPLTRAIYRAVPVGQEITPDLYEAVAEVLAFVYRLRYPQPRAAA